MIMTISIFERTLLQISFSLAGLVFSLVLYVMLIGLGIGKEHENLKFQRVTMTVVVGNIVSIIDHIFRRADIIDTPYPVEFFLFLLVFLFFIYLTYCVSVYIETFFEETATRRYFQKFNKILLYMSIFTTVYTFFCYVFELQNAPILAVMPLWLYWLLSRGIGFYYLIYASVLLAVNRNKLDRRTRVTALVAFIAVAVNMLGEMINPHGLRLNYFGAVLGIFIFYIGVETPDYKRLLQTVDELVDANEAADAANRSKSEFLANMSHEIRTPINAVIGMNEMIIRESGDEKIVGYARNVESAGKNLLSIINDILDISKIEAGKLEIVPAEYRFSSLLNDVANMLSFRAEAKGLEFKVNVDENLPDGLYGDEVRVRQIIVNILTNAVKYTNCGSVSFDVNGERDTKDGVDIIKLFLKVSDTGIGIKEEDMPKLFTKFNRMDMVENKNIEGTGLGLAITMNLLEKMDGTIDVDSVYGEGTTFSLMIPQKIVEDVPVGNYKERFESSLKENVKYQRSFEAPEARILAVDDTPVNLSVVKSLLKKTRIIIDTASGGEEALKLAKNVPYDVILMDYRMPQMDGTETLKLIRNQYNGENADTPVICLTADAVSGAKDRYLADGYNDYLTKPVEAMALEQMLAQYIPDEKITYAEDFVTDTEYDASFFEEEDTGLYSDSRLYEIYMTDPVLSYKSALDILESEETLAEVLKQFYDSIDEYNEEIERYLTAKDYKNYTVKVHALKSSAKTIGAPSISEEAKELERLGNVILNSDDESEINDACEVIEKTTPSVLMEVRRLKEVLESLYEVEKTPIDPEYLKEIFATLAELVGAYDMTSIEAVLKEVEGFSLFGEDEIKMEKIKRAVGSSDWKLLEELLK